MHSVKILVLYRPLFRSPERYRVQDVDSVHVTRGKVVPLRAGRQVLAAVQFHAFVTSALGGEWSSFMLWSLCCHTTHVTH